jgi:hypothetical protein
VTRGSSSAHAELLRGIREEFGARPAIRIFSNPRGFDERSRATYGLAPGASDLVAIQRLERAAALAALSRIERGAPAVGDFELVRLALRPVGRFVGLEVKSGGAKSDAQQQRFRKMVNDLGGVGREVRSLDDARAAFSEGGE